MTSPQIVDDYSPVYTNDTYARLAPQFIDADGYFDLTGATISMKMQNQDTGVVNTCTGTWIIDDAATGRAHYQYQAADVATAGIWILYVTITIGGKPIHADQRLLQILPAP